jgi:hypothetical protein
MTEPPGATPERPPRAQVEGPTPAPPQRPVEYEPPAPPRTPVEYEPPWREARRRVRLAWGRGGIAARLALAVGGVIAAVLVGAFLFGLWHVVVGGLVRGNAEAAGFGFALASVTGVLLWIEASIARRLLPA